MIGRGASGKPWLVKQIIDAMHGITTQDPDITALHTLVQNHYDAMIDHYGSHAGVGIARKHIGWYCEDLPESEAMRSAVNQMTDPQAVKDALRIYFETLSDNLKTA
jgi:tRNA-dihydrouridine synthase B